jgi:hypothetical protein
MKTLLTILTLVFTLVFSSPSFAGWTQVGGDKNETTYYVNFERIRKHDGFVYYWDLSDYVKSDKDGDLSVKVYIQGDCILLRYKVLNGSFYKDPMGKGTPSASIKPDKEWDYPTPNSPSEVILKQVCSR